MDVSGFMIDMDGTIYKGGILIPGAVEFIEALKAKGIPFVFLTNNSSNARSHYSEKLERMGFRVSEDNVLTSTVATVRFLRDERPGCRAYVLASPEVEAEFAEAGITVTDELPDTVVLTFDKTIDFGKINNAYHFIMAGAEFVATHPDDLCPTEDGYDVDIGGFIRLLESLTGKKALVVGKPNARMLHMAAAEMGVDPARTVMVGDRLYTDMKMAEDAGTASILVLSGETSREDLERSGMRPTHVLDSVKDILGLL
jgi:HAD superfamily hydrolase (TIGR01457 family)